MGTSLTGLTPATTYDALIKVTDNGSLSGTAKYLSDGLGNDSALALSTTAVGIGTASPAGRLSVEATGNHLTVRASTAAAGKYWALDVTAANQLYIINNAGTQYLTITDAGNVGIGTSSPAFKLSVKGGYIQNTDGTRSVLFGSDGTGTLAGTNTNHYFRFITNDVERLRITENGYVRLSSGSGGIQFNSDTAAANALDDYEEGTFTPTTFGDPTGAFSGTTGEYTKIGNVVNFRIVVNMSSTFTDNYIGGLPFTVGGSVSVSSIVGAFNVANNLVPNMIATTTSGQSYIRFYTNNDLATQAPPTAFSTLRIFGTYRV